MANENTSSLTPKEALIKKALAHIENGNVASLVCVLPATTFVKVTRVVNYIVSETSVESPADAQKCPPIALDMTGKDQ